ncbi:phage tail protein [Vibrio parahaemolyticus]|uniref:phage tail protein n=1 Tax=Vibrio parahaemolyticus TaxID=670 RepID=UPI0038924A15
MGSSKSTQVGTKWYWGQHLVLCHSPIDAIKRIWFGEQVGWEGNVTENQTIEINEPTLFGEEDSEGGVSGKIDAMFGQSDQGANDYLSSKLGSPLSAFRHLVSLVFRQCYMGNSPYPSTVAVEAERIHTGWDGGAIWQPELADCGNGLNAVHLIYELIYCSEWGGGISNINEEAFIAAATVTKDEGFGLNLFWSKQQPVEDAISDVCEYINAMVFNDEVSGKITIKLIRDDYIADDLPVLTAKQIRTVKDVKRRSASDAINTLTVSYTDSDTYDTATIVVRNSALLRANGQPIAESADYPMIYDGELAYKVAMRQLKLLSTRIMSSEIYCDTTAGNLQPGDVFKCVLPEAGLNHIMRVQSKKRGPASNPEIQLTVVEDIFSPTFGAYIPPPQTDWVAPDYSALPVELQLAIEAPYWWLATTFTTSELNTFDSESGLVLWQAIAPSQESLGAELNYGGTDNWTYSHKAAFAPELTLQIALSRTATTASIKNVDASILPILCQINQELIVITGVTDTDEATLTRGVLDTMPQSHEANDALYQLSDGALTNEFSLGESVTVQSITYTPSEKLPEEDATTASVDIVARANKPLTACNVTFNGEYWPESIVTPLTLKWSHRNRLSEITNSGDLSDWYSDGIAEPGTTSRVRALDDLGNEIISIETEATELTLESELSGYESVTIEIHTLRDGIESYLPVIHSMTMPAATLITSLLNSNAEDGTNHWTNETGSLGLRSDDPAPFEGTQYFTGGNTSQMIAVNTTADIETDTGMTFEALVSADKSVSLSWQQTSWAGSDKAALGLRQFDESGVLLNETEAEMLVIDDALGWQLRRLVVPLVEGVKSVAVVLHCERHSGTNSDGYIDAIEMRV